MQEIGRVYKIEGKNAQQIHGTIEHQGYSFEWIKDSKGRATHLGIYLGEELCGISTDTITTDLRGAGGRALDKLLAEMKE
jgi:hypothetical protein